MDRRTFLAFLQRLLKGGSEIRAVLSLTQLRKILEEQNAPEQYLRDIDRLLNAIPEAVTAAERMDFGERELEEAVRRAEDRRRWEASRNNYGRCG